METWAIVVCSLVGFAAVFLSILRVLRVKLATTIEAKHVVITGGSSGLGLCVAKHINEVNPSCKITLIARNLKKLQEAQTQLSNCEILSLDMTGNKQKTIETLQTQITPFPDIVICSAGAAVAGRFEDLSIETYEHQINLNYYGMLVPAKAFLPGMKERRSGRICFVSSVAGQLGVWGFSAYSASKFAVVGLAQALASELRPFNVGVTVCYPPDMDTPGLAEENKNKPWECQKISETGGLVQPEPVAKALWDDVLASNFFSAYGLDAWLSTVMAIGWSPSTGCVQAFLEIFLAGVLRFGNLCYMKYFDYVAEQGKVRREKKG